MESTIPFQQQFFAQRIVDGKIDSRSCRDWYHEARLQQTPWVLSSSAAANVDGYPSLIQGIITTLFAMPSACVLPNSFQFDLKRLERIDADTQDLLHLRMAILVFDELRFWLASGRANTVSPEISLKLQSRILAIVDEQADNEDPWQTSSADVALEITRAAYTICGSSEVAVPDSVIQRAHLRLDDLRCGVASECALIKDILQVELTIKAIHYAQVFNDKTPLEMSDAQQQWRQQRERNTSFHPLPEIEDIARRVAHVGIIHWKIWANLVYLDEVEVLLPELSSTFNPPSDPYARDRTGTTSVLSSSIEMAVD
jgi:T-complex protein 11